MDIVEVLHAEGAANNLAGAVYLSKAAAIATNT